MTMTAKPKRKDAGPRNPGDALQTPINWSAQSCLLIVLLLLLAVVVYAEMRPSAVPVKALATEENVDALQHVDGTPLHVDLLDRLKQSEYLGSRRNIFDASPPPPSVPDVKKPTDPAVVAYGLAAPLGPPPLIIPAQFFGYVTDARTGVRRAFFSQGEDIYVLGVGELLACRFRLVQIGDDGAQLEDAATGLQAKLPMADEPGHSAESALPQIATAGPMPPGFGLTLLGQIQKGVPQISANGRTSPLDDGRGVLLGLPSR